MPITISGNTYPVKDQLKALGGRWDHARKAWMVPEDKAEQARSLLKPYPERQPRRTNGSRRKACSHCGKSDCARAWDPSALCDDD